MNTPWLTPFVLFALLGATRLPAQDLLQAAAAPAVATPVRDQGLLPDGTPAGAWAAGVNFKCGFADGAFTLVPYLGRLAPANAPWRWRTVAATVAGHDLLQGEPVHTEHGDRVLAGRRGLVTERWHVRADGVEQSFVVAARPAVGPLVVRGRIDGALDAAPRAARTAPLVFRDRDGRVALHYGEALAIDADGRRWPVPTSFDGEHLALHVAADTVAAARFPLLLDPLLNVYVVESGSSAGSGVVDSSIDHVDATDGLTMVRAEVRWASALDGDLFVWKSRADFVVSQLVYSDVAPQVQAFDVSVAGVATNRSYVVAWSRGPTGSSPSVSWFVQDADSFALPTIRTAVRPSGTTERAPRVGGRRGQNPGAAATALLVRLRETGAGTDHTELWGSVLDCIAGTEGTPFLIAGGGTAAAPTDNDEPWVNRDFYGATTYWAVAHQSWVPADGRWTVRVRRVSPAGTVTGNWSPTMLQSGGLHAMQPRVEGDSTRLLLAFATAPVHAFPGKLTSYGGQNVYVQRFDWSGLTVSEPHVAWNVAASFQRDLVLGGLAHDLQTKSHWALAHGPAQGVPTVQQLGFRGRVIRSAALPGPGASAGQLFYRPASLAFDAALGRFALHYGLRSSSGGVSTYYVYAGRYDYPMAATSLYGAACSAGQVGTTPRFLVGDETPAIGLYTTQPGAPVLLAFSLGPAAIPLASLGLAGSCSLLLDPAAPNWIDVLVHVTDGSGDARCVLPLPENLAPLDLHAQWFRLSPTGAMLASAGVRCEIR